MADQDKPQAQEPTVDGADAAEKIRRRAYEISQSRDGGTAEENWHRAEREAGDAEPSATGRA
jgi:hypothetical protein